MSWVRLIMRNRRRGQLRRDDTFYDIGANIGFFTLLAARLRVRAARSWHGTLLPNIEQLRKNVALNDFENVTIIPAAVSAEESIGRFSDRRP